MSILIGHASISENGTISGTKGDQTGKEVCIRPWYKKPWDWVAIHPDAEVREMIAHVVELACANNNIGYSQYSRNTLFTEAKKYSYNISKVGKCNTDCSALVNLAVAIALDEDIYGSNGWTTRTMKSELTKHGFKFLTGSYIAYSSYCVRGGIYNKSGSHVVTGLTDGSNANKTLSAVSASSSITPTPVITPSSDNWVARLQAECNSQGYSNQTVDNKSGPITLAGCPLLSYGDRGNITGLLQERLNKFGYDLGSYGIDKDFGSVTKSAVKQYQKDNDLLVDGIVGKKTWSKLLGL